MNILYLLYNDRICTTISLFIVSYIYFTVIKLIKEIVIYLYSYDITITITYHLSTHTYCSLYCIYMSYLNTSCKYCMTYWIEHTVVQYIYSICHCIWLSTTYTCTELLHHEYCSHQSKSCRLQYSTVQYIMIKLLSPM